MLASRRRGAVAMSVFDDIDRVRVDSPQQDETAFAYLNASARTEADRVRKLVDSWFDRYPASHRNALVERFRSTIDDHHLSAFFELFLHELALTRGFKVLAIEPELQHTPKSPDFLIESPDGARFYLEAVLATGRSQEATAAQARLNQALTAIDATPSPAHFLDLTVHGVPAEPVSTKNLKRELGQWIAALPEGDAAREVRPFVFIEHGMRLTITAFPRHNRERATRAIGVRHTPLTRVKIYDDIRGALKKKASRYGALDYPYIVAVHTPEFFPHEENAIGALIGTLRTVVIPLPDGTKEFDDRRNSDGIWIGPNGPRKTGLSAVLVVRSVDPWNFASRGGCLIRNPWAASALPPIPLGIDELNPFDGEFHRTKGKTFGDLFALPKDWPEE